MNQPPLVSVPEMEAHSSFLCAVHSSPDGGDHLYLGEGLLNAIHRYLSCWLPLVAANENAVLIPPVDLAWMWHLHRLAPLRYAAYTQERFGRILECQAVFQCQERNSNDPLHLVTREVWRNFFGNECAFFETCENKAILRRGDRDARSNQTTVHPTILQQCNLLRQQYQFDYDIASCSSRQRTFLWQIMRPNFAKKSFLQQAVSRYGQFLNLMLVHGYENHFFVPSYDIDFAWHTHMLTNTERYMRETCVLAGAFPHGVNHDDSVNQRDEESHLNVLKHHSLRPQNVYV